MHPSCSCTPIFRNRSPFKSNFYVICSVGANFEFWITASFIRFSVARISHALISMTNACIIKRQCLCRFAMWFANGTELHLEYFNKRKTVLFLFLGVKTIRKQKKNFDSFTRRISYNSIRCTNFFFR